MMGCMRRAGNPGTLRVLPAGAVPVRVRIVVILALFLGLPAIGLASLAGQTVIEVRGTVTEQGTGRPIRNATVELDGFAPVLTPADGTFRFGEVSPGGRALRVTALGYAPRDMFLVLRQDTVLTVELTVAPVALDTLAVRGERIDVRGLVREKGSDFSLSRAEVVTSLNRGTFTNTAGRFRLRDVPSGASVAVGIRAFGYLPLDTVVVAQRDTTLTFDMEVDSLVQRMISVEVAKIVERSKPYRTALMPAIDRATLLRRANWTVLDVIESEYGIYVSRVRCIVIDERQSHNGREELRLMLPDELERVEVLERGAMLRIYTREFIKSMLGGGIRLRRPVYIPYSNPPTCL